MPNALATVSPDTETQVFVTFRMGQQRFGISILRVRDVLRYQPPSPIPLAPSMVAGALNLKGKVVTAIDMRVRLGMPAHTNPTSAILVAMEYQQERFALIVDSIGEAVTLEMAHFQRAPSSLDPAWQKLIAGVFALESELLIILDPARLIDEPQA